MDTRDSQLVQSSCSHLHNDIIIMMHWIVLGITLCIVINQNITSAFETLVHPSTFVEVHELGNTDGNRITENAAIYLDISMQECSRRCQHMKACDFVNYHDASQTCFIVRHEDTTIGVTFKHRKGFTLGVKTDWTFVSVNFFYFFFVYKYLIHLGQQPIGNCKIMY